MKGTKSPLAVASNVCYVTERSDHYLVVSVVFIQYAKRVTSSAAGINNHFARRSTFMRSMSIFY